LTVCLLGQADYVSVKTPVAKFVAATGAPHQVGDWYRGVEIKIGRRQGGVGEAFSLCFWEEAKRGRFAYLAQPLSRDDLDQRAEEVLDTYNAEGGALLVDNNAQSAGRSTESS
jgi:hypothetical protein